MKKFAALVLAVVMALGMITAFAESVEPSVTPSASPTPEATIDPSTTPGESTTPEISTTPGESATPEVSTSPDASTSPDPSTTPGESATPEVSTSPDASTSPDPSTTPGESATPEVSTSPESSTEPEPTATPAQGTLFENFIFDIEGWSADENGYFHHETAHKLASFTVTQDCTINWKVAMESTGEIFEAGSGSYKAGDTVTLMWHGVNASGWHPGPDASPGSFMITVDGVSSDGALHDQMTEVFSVEFAHDIEQHLTTPEPTPSPTPTPTQGDLIRDIQYVRTTWGSNGHYDHSPLKTTAYVYLKQAATIEWTITLDMNGDVFASGTAQGDADSPIPLQWHAVDANGWHPGPDAGRVAFTITVTASSLDGTQRQTMTESFDYSFAHSIEQHNSGPTVVDDLIQEVVPKDNIHDSDSAGWTVNPQGFYDHSPQTIVTIVLQEDGWVEWNISLTSGGGSYGSGRKFLKAGEPFDIKWTGTNEQNYHPEGLVTFSVDITVTSSDGQRTQSWSTDYQMNYTHTSNKDVANQPSNGNTGNNGSTNSDMPKTGEREVSAATWLLLAACAFVGLLLTRKLRRD